MRIRKVVFIDNEDSSVDDETLICHIDNALSEYGYKKSEFVSNPDSVNADYVIFLGDLKKETRATNEEKTIIEWTPRMKEKLRSVNLKGTIFDSEAKICDKIKS